MAMSAGARVGRQLASWFWASVPVWTLGFGTAAVMIHAARKKSSRLQAATVPVYAVGLGLVLLFDPDDGGRPETLFGIGMAINMGLGLLHAVAIRTWVFDLAPVSARAARRRSLKARQKAALAAHDEREQARAAALRIVAERPRLAQELGIGRPDLPHRDYPDGGLVDVNNVPAGTLRAETGLPRPIVDRVVELRTRTGGFSSVDDLSVVAGLPPHALDGVAHRLVFLPPVTTYGLG